MKKILLLLSCFFYLTTHATVWNVTVQDFQFSPANLNVKVGDVIHWKLVGGFHTTSSLSVPAGAASWDADLTTPGAFFDYIVTATGSYSYQCDFHPTLMQGSFTATSVTPVTLSGFNVSDKNGKAELAWTTLTELNANYFSIRKSMDGSNFKEIAKVPAAGNSSLKKNYSFTDDEISSTTRYVYYALATVDRDGKIQLSPIKLFKNKQARSKIIVSLSPNPISDMGHLMIKFNADKPGQMNAKLIDDQGKLIMETNLAAAQGINNGHIHLGVVAKGTYTLQFSLEGISESYRIIRN
ncbi:MAG: T9SS type A sorting domain-containing protein [Ginsengibacter sp.]